MLVALAAALPMQSSGMAVNSRMIHTLMEQDWTGCQGTISCL